MVGCTIGLIYLKSDIDSSKRRIDVMSNIVVIFSSPRAEGNSCTLGKAVMGGAMGLSMNTIKIHRLNSLYSVRGCQNCDRCSDGSPCYIEDDIKQVLEDIKECDSLIISMPMYFNGPCAQFKVLEDRLFSHMTPDLKPRYPGKKLVIILTHDDKECDGIADMVMVQLKDVFERKLGFNIIGTINYRCDRNCNSAASDKELLDYATNLGKQL